MENNKNKIASLSDKELLEQTEQQYRVVVHLAGTLVDVHKETLESIAYMPRAVIEMRCKRSAEIMESLGDFLNNMEAVDTKRDGWTGKVFAKAHKILSR